ncbi:MAG: hypothetical protein Kow0060_24550 [Methylohalobius crimeensis]
MLTRRRFLGYSAAGFLAATAGCRPANLKWFSNPQEESADTRLSLADKARIAELKNRFLGYPVNMNTPPEAFFAWRHQLFEAGIDRFAYNNVGNPFQPSPIPYNTHDFERETILRFGELFAFSPGNLWGFLSHSGTDSNMHGMYMGRTLLKGRTGETPKAYFTKESHYSIQILADLLGLERIMVDTLPDSGMDPDNLGQKLADNPNHPALVVATTGTTFKGGIDWLDPIQKALQEHPSYLHLDAALFGGYLPHTTYAGEVLQASENNPTTGRYDSIAVSCHKFFGFPSPAGLFITTESNFNEFNELYSQIHSPEYIGHVPGTITCSRDGVKPAEFYFFSTPSAWAKQTEDAQAILQNADYLMGELQTHFLHLQPQRANALSNTVYFEKPADWVVEKYSLATMQLEIDGMKEDYAHVVVMPHADRKVLSEFLTDLDRTG